MPRLVILICFCLSICKRNLYIHTYIVILIILNKILKNIYEKYNHNIMQNHVYVALIYIIVFIIIKYT